MYKIKSAQNTKLDDEIARERGQSNAAIQRPDM